MTGRRTRALVGTATTVLVAAALAAPIAAADGTDAVINEFSASTIDGDVEYVELYGTPGIDYANLSVLELEGDATSNRGVVEEVIAGGLADADGLFLADLPINSLENGTLTLLLVDGFTGALGQDLDTNDDGTLDATPWTSVVDAVAVSVGGEGDRTYGDPVLAAGYDQFGFPPGGASRIPNGCDTDTAGDWVRNDFDLAGIEGFTGSPVAGEAYNTPGAPNQAVAQEIETCGDGNGNGDDGDTTAPEITVTVTPDTVQPNNHKYLVLGVTVTASDDRDADVDVELIAATSDEPDDDLGDGTTINDVLVNGDTALWDSSTLDLVDPVAWDDATSTLQVRAERMGGGDGRVYTFTWRATDDALNTATATATVTIPKG